jgi:hypothetical protein
MPVVEKQLYAEKSLIHFDALQNKSRASTANLFYSEH